MIVKNKIKNFVLPVWLSLVSFSVHLQGKKKAKGEKSFYVAPEKKGKGKVEPSQQANEEEEESNFIYSKAFSLSFSLSFSSHHFSFSLNPLAHTSTTPL